VEVQAGRADRRYGVGPLDQLVEAAAPQGAPALAGEDERVVRLDGRNRAWKIDAFARRASTLLRIKDLYLLRFVSKAISSILGPSPRLLELNLSFSPKCSKPMFRSLGVDIQECGDFNFRQVATQAQKIYDLSSTIRADPSRSVKIVQGSGVFAKGVSRTTSRTGLFN
jgi:hypothetical protein